MQAKITKLEADFASKVTAQQRVIDEKINTAFVNADTKIATYSKDVDKKVNRVRQYADDKLAEMVGMVNTAITGLENRIDGKITSLKKYASELAYGVLNQAMAEIGRVKVVLLEQIEKIRVRLNTIRDPSTGLLSPFEVIYLNLFELHRENAFTAAGYDSLTLPAIMLEKYSVEAFSYDVNGKNLLEKWDKEYQILTADEYDGLLLTVAQYDQYRMQSYEYDLMGKSILI